MVSSPPIGRLITSGPMISGQRFPPAEGSSCHFSYTRRSKKINLYDKYTYILLRDRGRVLRPLPERMTESTSRSWAIRRKRPQHSIGHNLLCRSSRLCRLTASVAGRNIETISKERRLTRYTLRCRHADLCREIRLLISVQNVSHSDAKLSTLKISSP